jgi:hypothetical protein
VYISYKEIINNVFIRDQGSKNSKNILNKGSNNILLLPSKVVADFRPCRIFDFFFIKRNYIFECHFNVKKQTCENTTNLTLSVVFSFDFVVVFCNIVAFSRFGCFSACKHH